jgi:hypothetical protein
VIGMRKQAESDPETTPAVSVAHTLEVLAEQPPVACAAALVAVTRCAAKTVLLLKQGRIHLPREHVGMRMRFGDGTLAHVYRETIVDSGVTRDPCVLVVEFKLRAVRGRGHTAFRWESLLNTPLFVGFPGFVSKLWLAHDERSRYRGLYEWDGSHRAVAYARALWRVLALVSVPGSIHYIVLPGLRRDELLSRQSLAGTETDALDWWRPVAVG